MPDIFVTPDEQIHLNNPPVIPSKPKEVKEQKKKIQRHPHNPLSSFAMYPAKAHFETRESDEEIILILRQHPIINLKWILITILMVLAPGFVAGFGIFESFPAGFGLIMSLSWYLITTAYALESFMSWYFNVYIITDRRIVDVDFYNLIYKQVSDAQLDKIEDVTYNMGGVVRTVFNYGNIMIQTAGEINQFEFNAVPQPDKVAKIIQDLMTP